MGSFASMRGRSLSLTDVVVLVVAADQGVQETTREVITMARDSNVPLVVALTKVDLPEADPAAVRQDLMEMGVVTEDLGGEVLSVEVSAKSAHNVDALLEALMLQASLADDVPPPKHVGQAMALVLESRMDAKLGSIVTAIVKSGSIAAADNVVVDHEWGRIKALRIPGRQNDLTVAATIGQPIEIHGLRGLPKPGAQLIVVDSEQTAKMVAEMRDDIVHEMTASSGDDNLSDDELYDKMVDESAEARPELPLILKVDNHGSVEVIRDAISKMPKTDVRVQMLESEPGNVSNGDVMKAKTCGAELLVFNAKVPKSATKLAKGEGVLIHHYTVLYEMLDAITAMMLERLPGEVTETVLGRGTVKKLFDDVQVAGCAVNAGEIVRQSKVHVYREGKFMFETSVADLHHRDKRVDSMAKGTECGVRLKHFSRVRQGDTIQCVQTTETKYSLDEAQRMYEAKLKTMRKEWDERQQQLELQAIARKAPKPKPKRDDYDGDDDDESVDDWKDDDKSEYDGQSEYSYSSY